MQRRRNKLLGSKAGIHRHHQHIVDNIENFRIDPDKLRAVGRMAGSTYVRTTDRFELERPK